MDDAKLQTSKSRQSNRSRLVSISRLRDKGKDKYQKDHDNYKCVTPVTEIKQAILELANHKVS